MGIELQQNESLNSLIATSALPQLRGYAGFRKSLLGRPGFSAARSPPTSQHLQIARPIVFMRCGSRYTSDGPFASPLSCDQLSTILIGVPDARVGWYKVASSHESSTCTRRNKIPCFMYMSCQEKGLRAKTSLTQAFFD